DAGVVDQNMEIAECFDRLVDQALRTFPVGHVVVVGDGFAAGGHDLIDDLLGRGPVCSGPVGVATQVVDDDLGTLPGDQERVLPADASPGTSDDRHAACQSVHYVCSVRLGPSSSVLDKE